MAPSSISVRFGVPTFIVLSALEAQDVSSCSLWTWFIFFFELLVLVVGPLDMSSGRNYLSQNHDGGSAGKS